ncbi:MAG: arsenite S-adenosylmethyltransferase [Deltaproteobacteria bacterium]|nr:arsenite methyltransferase [Deltaproteobacteria bacterium]RLB93176.1 MAG: arsenite S-adenosylmethyltransferase [Deltaproteobacteria bacterium]
METLKNDEIRQAVRRRYSRIVDTRQAGCGCAPGCCGAPAVDAAAISQAVGYSPEEVGAVPEGANLGLGCGNPQAIAALKAGEVVLDLGSGGGFDCFLAARQVGETGRVIGVDMTPEMISRARANAQKGGFGNVEFRLGEIENLPVADNTADVVISNCVINLSPDKPRVFAEIYRALKPGGRVAVSDVVATAQLPEAVRQDLALRAGCIAGASLLPEVEAMLYACGFVDIRVTPKEESKTFIREWAPGTDATNYVVSADIHAVKPAARP